MPERRVCMITCTLKDKKYTVYYITGRALREM